MPPIYEALDAASYQIRLLYLHPDPKDAVVRCDLERVNFADGHHFVALSYQWGDDTTVTDIVVNGVVTPVHENLQRALRRLCTMKVERVWADALCINQSDDMEKTLQVRMMRHIYSAAYKTFAWLGECGADGAAAAIIGMKTRPPELSQQLDDSGATRRNNDVYACHDCQLRSTFRNIEDLFNRGYWRRRWIVQEIAASAQVVFGCGTETISFEELREAVHKYQSHSGWRPTNDTAYRHFRKIIRLRDLVGAGTLSLIETLLETQDFLSKDKRDNIFAIVGISYDGPNLVPSPDYRQSPNNVARDLTRSLIRRNGCFGVIVADQSKRYRPDDLPTWVPNWLSGDLPNDRYFAGCTRPSFNLERDDEMGTKMPLLSQRFRQRCLDGHPNTLVMEGLVLGTIYRMTSIINARSDWQMFNSEINGSCDSSVLYYCGHDGLLTALLNCILTQEEDWWHLQTVRYLGFTNPFFRGRKWSNRFKILFFNDVIKQAPGCGESLGAAREIYLEWFYHNAHLLLDGKPLAKWFDQTVFMRWMLLLIEINEAWVAGSFVLSILLTCSLTFPLILSELALRGFHPWGRASRDRLMERKTVSSSMLFTSQRPVRLLVCDTGMLGMGSQHARVGDQICLLAGCATPVIVRRKRETTPWIDSRRPAYEVVCSATICLSEKDDKRLSLFIDPQPSKIENGTSWYESEISELRDSSDWQEFVLI
ncbi:heterokaryon incompatibility protein-domain-containing protein [Xylaria scruposa]|nr:heterokaryon incompatibility protein-domain-containing protein [Xylaria scruposa]